LTVENPPFDLCADPLDLTGAPIYDYFVVNAEETTPSDLQGKRDADINNGILHLELWRRIRGVVKTVKFNKDRIRNICPKQDTLLRAAQSLTS
jgi:hypothetical protein